MPGYEIGLSSNQDYIVCTVYEPITIEAAQQITLGMLRVSSASGLKRYLFDVRDAPHVSDVARQNVYVNREAPVAELLKNARAAVVIDPTDRTHDFMENALQNAGFNLVIFEDFDKAVSWLKEFK